MTLRERLEYRNQIYTAMKFLNSLQDGRNANVLEITLKKGQFIGIYVIVNVVKPYYLILRPINSYLFIYHVCTQI
jgi:hypothetical protein